MQASALLCSFCGLQGHVVDTCHRFNAAKAQATKDAQQKQEERKNGRKRAGKANAAQESAPSPPGSSAQTEFAGKASLTPSPSSSSPQTASNHLWTADTGATSHMTPHKHWLRNYTPLRIPVRLANNHIVYSEGVGSVVFAPEVKGELVR